MFDNLSNRLDGIVKRIRGKGRLTEADVDEVMRRSARRCSRPTSTSPSSASVVQPHPRAGHRRHPLAGARPRPAGRQDRQRRADPHPRRRDAQDHLRRRSRRPSILMAGLQGSGKTTNSAKLACWFKAQGRNPLLVGADLQRPAAVEQLRTLGRQIDVPGLLRARRSGRSPRPRASQEAKRLGRDVAHRRHRRPPGDRRRDDGAGPADLRRRRAALHVPRRRRDDRSGRRPDVAEAFHQTLADRRRDPVEARRRRPRWRRAVGQGGHRRPIAFASTGEKLDAFEQFHPDRMAGRILGMGDMLTLIEQAEQAFETDQAEEAAAQADGGRSSRSTTSSSRCSSSRRWARSASLLGMMPGMPKELKDAKIDDDDLKPIEAIIRSMTLEERARPQLINGQRRHAHRQRLGHRRRRTSTASSSSSARCRR